MCAPRLARCASARFGHRFDNPFSCKQVSRRPEDDAARIAKTVAENHEDEGLREGFVELVIQL